VGLAEPIIMQIAKISLLLICLNLERFIHLKKEYVFALLSGAFVPFQIQIGGST
jgi:hypothetical protein